MSLMFKILTQDHGGYSSLKIMLTLLSSCASILRQKFRMVKRLASGVRQVG